MRWIIESLIESLFKKTKLKPFTIMCSVVSADRSFLAESLQKFSCTRMKRSSTRNWSKVDSLNTRGHVMLNCFTSIVS